ncbi:Transmembrane protein 185B [Echinococcus multilocularis]|uniref:Transmembrane protein 185B n=1 Tax=Echinococcus multilocularis TaxID=6211 RepID=A0A087W1J0_ECHMU|nr:Transmembrane protein 185B [Echinococcus multilocularis]
MEPPYFCDNFNRRQFVALSLVFMFIALLSLRLDDFIYWPYWVVFFPLWLWEFVVFGGFLFEVFAFCRSPRCYIEMQSHFKSVFFDAFFHTNLLFFGVLTCNRLGNAHHNWMSAYIPLIILSIFGLFVSCWAIKNDFDGDLHFIVSSHILFFILVALKVERFITLSWRIVFIPSWVAFAFFFILEFTEIVLSISRFACVNKFPDYRQQSFCISVGYSTSLLLIATSGVLLALRLDDDLRLPFVIIASPLMSALTVFMSLCFSGRPHFQWRRCFQLFYRHIIELCHPLQEYGNISYKLSSLHKSSMCDRTTRGENQQSSPRSLDSHVVMTGAPPSGFESPKSPSKSVRVESQEAKWPLEARLLLASQHGDDQATSQVAVSAPCPASTRLDVPD